jgi:hypothetical protein
MESRFPQELIDNIIGNIEVDEKYLLRTLSLVSRSFLYPSRKKLFAKIALIRQERSHGLLSVFTQHQYIQSSVRHLDIHYQGSHCGPGPIHEPTLLSLLRLPLLSLRTLVLHLDSELRWPKLSSDLRDALSDMIHSPSLTSFELIRAVHIPTTLFLGLKRVRSLNLYRVHLSDVDDKHGVSQIAGQVVSEDRKIQTSAHDRAPIESFTWHLPQASSQ